MHNIVTHCVNVHRLEMDLPSTSKHGKTVDDTPAFNKVAYNSFGKASICSAFSAKSGGSTSTTGNENLDSLLKTISKDTNHVLTNNHESLNDVNSIRYVFYSSSIENCAQIFWSK